MTEQSFTRHSNEVNIGYDNVHFADLSSPRGLDTVLEVAFGSSAHLPNRRAAALRLQSELVRPDVMKVIFDKARDLLGSLEPIDQNVLEAFGYSLSGYDKFPHGDNPHYHAYMLGLFTKAETRAARAIFSHAFPLAKMMEEWDQECAGQRR